MNKKVLIIIVVVLLLGVGAFFVFNKKSDTNINDATASVTKSLKDLVASGVSQKCTFTSGSDSSLQEGVTYISNKKMRGDFTSNVSGKVVKSHMIVVENTSYIWTDDDKNGFKSTFSDAGSDSNSPESNGENLPSGIDVDKQGDYKCSAWVVDESFFVPPADVKFTDFSEMFKNTTGGPSSGTDSNASSQCAVCDSLSGDDKAQCKSALSCN